jgi:hypothetical protein
MVTWCWDADATWKDITIVRHEGCGGHHGARMCSKNMTVDVKGW